MYISYAKFIIKRTKSCHATSHGDQTALTDEERKKDMIGRCKRHVIINAVLLFEHILCVNSLHIHVIALISFQNEREINVNISKEFNFSEVHGAMNRNGSLPKFK